MLNRFSAFSGSIVTKILMVLLIASFALWGIGDMLGRSSGNHTLATVGNKTISVDAYRRELAAESEQVRRQLGANYSPELLKRLNVPQFVLQRMVQESLLQQEAERMGFIPDDTTVALEIRKTPAFINGSGVFDKARFENTLRTQGMSEKAYVEKLRMQLATDKLLNALAVDLPIGSKMLATLQGAHDQGRTVTLYRISGAALPPIAAPTEDDLVRFHKQYADLFTQPETRTVSFARFTASESKAPATISTEAIESYYHDHADQFQTQEKRDVEQLLYSSEEKARDAHKQLKLGTDFDEVAKTTAPINKNTLSLGLVDKRELLENAAEEIFHLKASEFTAPVKSAFGWHIFRVNSIEPAGVQPLDKVRAAIEAQLKRATSENALTDTINQIEDALAGGSTMKEAAAAVGLSVEQAGTFDKNGNTPQGTANKTIPDLDRFIDIAFKTDEKTESSVMTSKGGTYYVLRVDALTPEKLRPLSDVRAEVTAAYLRKQQEQAMANLASMVEKELATGKPAKDIITAHKLPVAASGTVNRSKPLLGDTALPPSLLNSVFSQNVGTLTTPVRDKYGDYLLANITGLAPAAGNSASDSASSKKQLIQTMQEEIMTQYMRHLESRYPVDVRQEIVDRLLQDTNDVTR